MSKEVEVPKEHAPVTGVVAEIVSDQEVILNRGSEHGLKAGDFFAILDPKASSVRDPETGESLGGIRKVKIVVRATDVAPKLTLARTFRTKRVNVGGNGTGGIAAFMGMYSDPPKWVDEPETFAFKLDGPRPIAEEESLIAIGDPFERLEYARAEESASVVVEE